MRRVAIYAMGGGFGHAMRGMALARALRRQGAEVLLLVPQRASSLAVQAGVPSHSPPQQLAPRRAFLEQWVGNSLRQFEPHILVVDVFPRGVLGEIAAALPHLAPRRVLMARWVQPQYYLADRILQSIRRHYHAVLWTEPVHPEVRRALADVPAHEVAPVLWVEPAEVRTREEGRAVLGLEPAATIVLGIGSGTVVEEQQQRARLRHLGRRLGFEAVFISHHGTAMFPAGAWMRCADVVVSAGGYQTCYELLQAGVKAVLWPLPRQIDDQEWRVRELLHPFWRMATSVAELQGALATLLADPVASLYGISERVCNGAAAAARVVLSA